MGKIASVVLSTDYLAVGSVGLSPSWLSSHVHSTYQWPISCLHAVRRDRAPGSGEANLLFVWRLCCKFLFVLLVLLVLQAVACAAGAASFGCIICEDRGQPMHGCDGSMAYRLLGCTEILFGVI
jgi:hypothetical protein